MKIIKDYVDTIADEIEDAKTYAEKYVECKSRGNVNYANKYKEMAFDELNHASNLREMDLVDIAELKKVYTMSEEEEEKWEHGHKHLTEQMAIVKHMLSM